MTAPTQTDEQQFDLDAVFDNAGGGSGAPSFAWPSEIKGNKVVPIIGGTIQGEITDVFVTVVKDAQTREPKLNRKGAQMAQVNLTLQTTLRNWEGCKSVPLIDPNDPSKGEKPAAEDTGERRIYVKFKMLDAIARAIKASPQTRGGPRVGAKVAVRLTKLEDVGQLNPLADYEARYEPPVADPAADVFNNANAAPAQPAGDPWASAAPAAGGFADEPPF